MSIYNFLNFSPTTATFAKHLYNIQTWAPFQNQVTSSLRSTGHKPHNILAMHITRTEVSVFVSCNKNTAHRPNDTPTVISASPTSATSVLTSAVKLWFILGFFIENSSEEQQEGPRKAYVPTDPMFSISATGDTDMGLYNWLVLCCTHWGYGQYWSKRYQHTAIHHLTIHRNRLRVFSINMQEISSRQTVGQTFTLPQKMLSSKICLLLTLNIARPFMQLRLYRYTM